MDVMQRIERALVDTVDGVVVPPGPPLLGAAIRYAVFPGGARLRPRLSLAVAAACKEDSPRVSDAAAVSIELLHCASLAHDDLPCFDDAPMRRGKASLHCAFGEPIALLAGDALIVLAFQCLAGVAADKPERIGPLLQTLGGAAGMPLGIAAGQAWESEPAVDLAAYQRSKTGSLFAAATSAGAAAAGAPAAPWRMLGERIGEAYQVADDIRDVAGSAEALGKPTGRDAALERPNIVLQCGMDGAIAHLRTLITEAVASIPSCPGSKALRNLITSEAERFLPKNLMRRAA